MYVGMTAKFALFIFKEALYYISYYLFKISFAKNFEFMYSFVKCEKLQS